MARANEITEVADFKTQRPVELEKQLQQFQRNTRRALEQLAVATRRDGPPVRLVTAATPPREKALLPNELMLVNAAGATINIGLRATGVWEARIVKVNSANIVWLVPLPDTERKDPTYRPPKLNNGGALNLLDSVLTTVLCDGQDFWFFP